MVSRCLAAMRLDEKPHQNAFDNTVCIHLQREQEAGLGSLPRFNGHCSGCLQHFWCEVFLGVDFHPTLFNRRICRAPQNLGIVWGSSSCFSSLSDGSHFLLYDWFLPDEMRASGRRCGHISRRILLGLTLGRRDSQLHGLCCIRFPLLLSHRLWLHPLKRKKKT